MIMNACSLVRPVWRVVFLIMLFANDGADTSRVCLPTTGQIPVVFVGQRQGIILVVNFVRNSTP